MRVMHRWILGAGLWLVGSVAQSAPVATTACPGAGAAVVERFLSADCPDCWSAAADGQAPPAAWSFDWITPAGDDAAMSAAALPEALLRAQRAGAVPPPGGQRSARQAARAQPAGLRLRVESGPAWQGYLGLQLEFVGRPPAGASAWLALVELLPAGSDGSPQPRQLLRAVSGPLPLDNTVPSRAMHHLAAMRWPDGARPERLQARGWIETSDGRLLAVAADRCGPR
jgi:hypothetical protein